MTFALLLIVAINGQSDFFILDSHLSRSDCVAAIHASKTRAALFQNADVSLACEPESD